MRTVVAALACLALVATAGAATGEVVVVPKPAFPPPLASFTPPGAGLRLQLVSTERRDPVKLGVLSPEVIGVAMPDLLAGERYSRVLVQPGTMLAVYGTNVIAAYGPKGRMKYAFDLRSFGFPPRSVAPRAYGPQEIVWARQVGRLLVVQTAHLGYAADSANRNGYLTAIDIETGRVEWRSRSLVANAWNFVAVKGVIVSGYGFTAERDWLYLLDVKTGRVLDRLAIPSMAERITRTGDRIVVQAYDTRLVARLGLLVN